LKAPKLGASRRNERGLTIRDPTGARCWRKSELFDSDVASKEQWTVAVSEPVDGLESPLVPPPDAKMLKPASLFDLSPYPSGSLS
jgi:hypothetical protein